MTTSKVHAPDAIKVEKLVDRPALPPTIHQSELNRLVQQLHHLREALRPFARFAEALPDMAPPGSPPRLTDVGPAFAAKNPRNPMGDEHVITFADIRHAKTLLDNLEKADFTRFIEKTEREIMGVPEVCMTRDCHRRVEGHEEWNLAGYCSRDCEMRTAATLKSGY